MKIAQFIDTEAIGGAETVLLRLSKALKDAGHEVVLLHFKNEELASRLESLGIPTVPLPHLRLYKSIWTLPFFALLFRRLVRRYKFDVLHSHLFGPVSAAGLAFFAARWIRVIGTLHDTYIIAERPKRAILMRMAAMGGCKLVTVAKSMQLYISKRSKIDERDIAVVYNGVEVTLPETEGQKQGLRAHLGLAENDYVFCCVARLVSLKGHDILLKAFSQLKGKNGAHLILVGEGECHAALKELTISLDISQNVHFLGERKDVPQILSVCNCFVLASHTEGLSCSIVEAMFASLPVIASDVGGNHELIAHGISGFLFEDANISQLSELLQEMLNNQASSKSMGEKGFQVAAEKFTLSKMKDGYLSLYMNNYHRTGVGKR